LNAFQVRSKLTAEIAASSHYFSEPDLTPVTSPVGSRPSSPVLSDSELEVGQRLNAGVAAAASKKQEEQSWEWGQLPSTSSAGPKDAAETAQLASGSASAAAIKSAESGQKSGQDKSGAEGSAGWVSYFWRGRQKNEKAAGNQVSAPAVTAGGQVPFS
jgi:hypothetical protein